MSEIIELANYLNWDYDSAYDHKHALDLAGILCTVEDDDAASPVRLFVEVTHTDRAREIIATVDASRPQPDATERARRLESDRLWASTDLARNNSFQKKSGNPFGAIIPTDKQLDYRDFYLNGCSFYLLFMVADKVYALSFAALYYLAAILFLSLFASVRSLFFLAGSMSIVVMQGSRLVRIEDPDLRLFMTGFVVVMALVAAISFLLTDKKQLKDKDFSLPLCTLLTILGILTFRAVDVLIESLLPIL